MALEPLAGYPPLPLRARVSVSCTDPGPWPPARLVPIGSGLPLQEVADGMKVMYEHVAGIDVHKDMTAPRGALLYSRFSREGFGGYSWV